MSWSQHNYDDNNEQDLSTALLLLQSHVLPMAFQAATQLDLFEIIARAGPGAQLSASKIASHIPNVKNPKAHVALDRILGLLASHSVLTCSLNKDGVGTDERVYGLQPFCKYLVRDSDGGSLVPGNVMVKPIFDSGFHLKDAVLEDVIPFQKANGVHVFQFMQQNHINFRQFWAPILTHTSIVMKKILEVYDGFQNRKTIVDVGGSSGVVIGMIKSKYPLIKAINFDLPQETQIAPPIPGVEHVGGDMFVSIPNGDTMFLKWVLHNWNNEQCVTILKNCYKAIPDDGMVVVLEMLLSTNPEDDASNKEVRNMDLVMNTFFGGAERTEKEFEALGKAAGFARMRLVCNACKFWVMEFYKT
ncbi:hypothetical protein Sjap_008716 [Stephania japonica]|uniref:O-methyltransferase n=1 Tax=Stephania japonica TaxID=461633 RepID=A0AAP0JSG2_9MAGN|nr:COMT protein [Stephania japonica]